MRIYTVWDSDYVLEDGKIKKASILRKIDPWLMRIMGCMFIAEQMDRSFSHFIPYFIKVIRRIRQLLKKLNLSLENY
jgi:hypothetical protein